MLLGVSMLGNILLEKGVMRAGRRSSNMDYTDKNYYFHTIL